MKNSGSQPSKCCDPLIQVLMLWLPQTIELFSLPLCNCSFTTSMNHIYICMVLGDLHEGFLTPKGTVAHWLRTTT